MNYPPGPNINFALLIIGLMFPKRYPNDPLAFGVKVAREFGDIAHYRLGPLHVYQLNHPDLARQVTVELAEKFYKPRLLKRAFRQFVGEGLITSDGALWKQQRKLIQPAFQHRQLAAYGEVMVEHAARMVDSFADGEVREIGAEMTKLTLGIVVKTLFGAELTPDAMQITSAMGEVRDAAGQRLNSGLQPPSWIPTRRNRAAKRVMATLDATLRALIDARRKSPETRHDLLSILLAAVDEDSGAQMSDLQLRDEMMTLFLAGHETTAGLLTWVWYLLARHPHVESKLMQELRGVLAGRAPTIADLPNLPYTERVIRETLRLYPPAPGFGREPIEDVNVGGYCVPKRSLLVVNTYAMQHDSRFFSEPETFDPDRFAPGWEERIPRHAYLPFGGGPRVCIGNGFAMMEVRLILATVAQRYKLSLDSAEEIKPV